VKELASVAVYCGSSDGLDPGNVECARDFGRLLATEGIALVYGGGNVGLMGAVADGALRAGGEVHGVITEALRVKELAHLELTSLIVVDTMHERKAAMADRADAFVALPGGFGTFDELFEVITLWDSESQRFFRRSGDVPRQDHGGGFHQTRTPRHRRGRVERARDAEKAAHLGAGPNSKNHRPRSTLTAVDGFVRERWKRGSR